MTNDSHPPVGGDDGEVPVSSRQGRETQLARHLREFRTLTLLAQREFERGDLETATFHAQTACAFAYHNHTGLWASPEVERMLVVIGKTALRAQAPSLPRGEGAGIERVLHVLSQVGAVGGHSRMVWRWMGQDDTRSHSVALTRQGSLPVPAELVEMAHRSSGSVHSISRSRGGMLSRAQALRDLAADFDLVILHIYAEDVVPLVAFADKTGIPPVAFLDQADHAFSCGAGHADIYVGLRAAGIDLAIERRGVDPSRVCELPITLPPIDRTFSRAEAKRRMGWPDDSVVLLSIARSTKFHPFHGEHYSTPLLDVLDRHPEAMLVVVGPDPDEFWSDAHRAPTSRVQVFGERPDTQLFFEAGDIYVDSFPVNSNTSLLEAGCYSLPLVSRCRDPGPHTILCADAPGFSKHIFRSSDVAEYASEIERLVADPERRRALGGETREAVVTTHIGAGWQGALEQLYAKAASVTRTPAPSLSFDVPRCEAIDLIWDDATGHEMSVAEIRSWFLKGLPLLSRLRWWIAVCASQRRLRPRLLVPEWVTGHVRKLARLTRPS